MNPDYCDEEEEEEAILFRRSKCPNQGNAYHKCAEFCYATFVPTTALPTTTTLPTTTSTMPTTTTVPMPPAYRFGSYDWNPSENNEEKRIQMMQKFVYNYKC